MVKTIIMVVYVIICIALTIIVLSQEGKSASSITGGNYDNSYWGKNKGSSKDAVLRKITTVLGVLFIVIALLLDSKLF